MNFRNVLEELRRILYGHIQYISNTLVLILNFKGLTIVSLSFAHFTRNIHIRQEVHLDFDDTVTATGFATSTFDVKTKTAFLIPAYLRLVRLREQIANVIKDTRVSGWI
ncbi:hypothetical protein D3C80_1797740 [compost metagenome]